MALRQAKTPPKVHPAHDDIAGGVPTNVPVTMTGTGAPPLQTPAAEGVGDRGVEAGVPWYTDSAGRKFIASPHPLAGQAW